MQLSCTTAFLQDRTSGSLLTLGIFTTDGIKIMMIIAGAAAEMAAGNVSLGGLGAGRIAYWLEGCGLYTIMAATRKEEKYVDLGARYIFEPIAIETLAPWTFLPHQLVTSSMTLEGGSLKTRARLKRPASCTKGFRFWRSICPFA